MVTCEICGKEAKVRRNTVDVCLDCAVAFEISFTSNMMFFPEISTAAEIASFDSIENAIEHILSTVLCY